jgi:hypothetical protein
MKDLVCITLGGVMMSAILGEAEQCFLSGILAFILATAIIGIYYGFCCAYKIFLNKLHVYSNHGS